MSIPDLLETLRVLERRLHLPEVRSEPGTAGGLLHPLFREFGRSGTAYTREQALDALAGTPQPLEIWSQDFAAEELQPGVALLTYRSALVTRAGTLEDHALRSSIWLLTDQGWQMRFHQGTPTVAFERNPMEAPR